MDQYLLENLTKKLKIAPLNIIRENVEMLILDSFAENDISQKMIFYGGTALRMAYGSPRFSEDLDFSMVKKIQPKELQKILENLIYKNKNLSLKDFKDKRKTLFAVIRVIHPRLKHSISIKIEISKKKDHIKYEILPLVSPCSHLKPLISTIKIESLKKLKEETIRGRNEPRDWFDLWYISKYLKQDFSPPIKFPFEKKEFKRELKRFLPQNKWMLIDQLYD